MINEYTATTEEVRWYVSNNGRIPAQWFDRWLQGERARTWDEGFDAGCKEAGAGPLEDFSVNPYRKSA